ncbi:MAG: DUF1016 domain-containing protein [Verrucomicrobiae bacterium]|nr:DUF1016 domain-containing protein [Verrucomicrobiae bacterium]
MNTHEGEFRFGHLVELFEQTQTAMRHQVARSVNIGLVVRNWLFGWYIFEFEKGGVERAELYGKKLMEKLASRLTERLGKGFSRRSLDQFRLFYERYEIRQTLSAESLAGFQIQPTGAVESQKCGVPEVFFDAKKAVPDIWQTLSAVFKLSWSHYVALLTLDNPEERSFYEIEAAVNSWSVRELERQIGSSLYERLALSRDQEEVKRLAKEGQVVEKAADLIKNPVVLEFLGLEERTSYSEEELETAIIDQLEKFLLELGRGFLFEARQKRFTFDNDHFYVDLVFYNRLLRCYVLIDLKRDKLTHQDLGQMQMYVNHFDRHVKLDDEAPTVGILLCHRKNDALVELTLPEDANIYASKYQLYLPSKQELKRQIEETIREQENAQKDLNETE